jgi:ABC-type antimicrobial peptide transport system permease subunit
VSLTRLIILRSIIVEAGQSLNGRRMQAALSSFGIATGIAAVVFLVAAVSGLHRMALQQFNTAGGNVIQVTAEADTSTRDPQGATLSLYEEDADAIVRASPYFDGAAVQNSASAVVRGVVVQGSSFVMNQDTGRGVSRPTARAYTASIRGVSHSGFELGGLRLAQGRLPSFAEFEAGARVTVLGPDAARQIFGAESPLGRSIILGDWPFVVVGVLDWIGNPEGDFRSGLDRLIYMPFRTVATTFRGSAVAASMSLRLKTPGTNELAVADARGILTRRLARHGQTSGRIAFTSAADRLAEMSLIVNGLKMLVAMVGGISLFVGAVGVTNVLLVSVRERTHEIGVRRAIGARRGHIFLGFLCEALVMTLGGGAVGILGAWLLTLIAGFLPIPEGAEPHISMVTAATAVSLLVIVGLIAGVGPARRAAAIFPAEALRAD